MIAILELTPAGLFCSPGGFYVDPWQPVDRAVVTHAHSDHTTPGSGSYLVAREGLPVFRKRLGADAALRGLEFGESVSLGETRVSLHPAGHILGSAQVRIEHRGQVAVISGDFKRVSDSTCTAFEPLRCHFLLTESTFGLPVYRWRPAAETADEINAWWRENQAAGRNSMLFAYALGKAQRILSLIDPSLGPILLHGAVAAMCQAYEDAGVKLPVTQYANAESIVAAKGRALVLAPPSALGSTWLRRFKPMSLALASGWMRIRGMRRRRAVDRGFVLSDHADWDGLLATIREAGAESVGVTHGYSEVLVEWLREQGLKAEVWKTRFEGEAPDVADTAPAEV